MPNFVRSFNPIWFFVDHFGQPLNDEYYFFVLENTVPYLPQPIFQDNQGMIPWSDPIEFQPSGTLPDNMYWDDSLVYRLEVRHGPTQDDALIWEINDYVPPSSGNEPVDAGVVTSNQVSNPQFIYGDFAPPAVLTAAGTYHIAPGWFLTLVGTGSTTLTRQAVTGNQNIDGNPPYVLNINNVGWTECLLYQRFSNEAALWANIAVTASVTAISEDGVARPITISYRPSNSSPTYFPTIASGTMSVAVYTEIAGAINITQSTSSDSGDNGYIDLVVTLPPVGVFNITNLQAIAQEVPLTLAYEQDSAERQLDHLFHFYKPQLAYKPIPSWLVGWDFQLNPAQFAGRAIAAQAAGVNKSYYAWDQTILFQSADSAITVGNGDYNALHLTAAVATQMAVIQYIPAARCRELLNDFISVNMAAVASANTKCTISLWYTKDGALPSTVISNNSLVATLDANGKPATFNGNWIEVSRANSQPAQFTVTPGTSANFHDYNFNDWSLGGSGDTNLATYFAIVIGTEAMIIGQALEIDSVGLMSGQIATRPAPQTQDACLRECQYYFEKSYAVGTLIGSATDVNLITAPQNMYGGANLYVTSIELQYKQTKYQTPVPFIFAQDGTATKVKLIVFKDGSAATAGGGSPNANPFNATQADWAVQPYIDRALLVSQGTTTPQIIVTSTLNEGFAQFHYALDSRLGQ